MRTSHSLDVTHLPGDLSARVVLCASAAARHEDRGDYEAAVEALGSVWDGPPARPDTGSLNPEARALVLLRAGSLTGWLGSKRQVDGWQEQAKNLLSESADIFKGLGNTTGWAEAQKCLAACYWRSGAFNEAKDVSLNALASVDPSSEIGLVLAINLGMIQRVAFGHEAALKTYRSVASLVDNQPDELIKGMFHNGLGLVWRELGRADDALLEMAAAAYFFEQGGQYRFQVATEITLSVLFTEAKEFEQAHQRLDRAERLAVGFRDNINLAQAKDSRALVYLAEHNLDAAEVAARESVQILSAGDQYGLLVDSLVTHARVLSRLRDTEALRVYVRAYELAADRIGSERAARVTVECLGALAGDACLTGHLSMDDAVDAVEKSIITAGLSATDGKITKTALLLGVKPQTFSLILKSGRHRDLHPQPTMRPRRQSIIK